MRKPLSLYHVSDTCAYAQAFVYVARLALFCSFSGELPPSDEFQSRRNVAENRLPLKSPHARCMSISVSAS